MHFVNVCTLHFLKSRFKLTLIFDSGVLASNLEWWFQFKIFNMAAASRFFIFVKLTCVFPSSAQFTFVFYFVSVHS